MSSQRDSRKSVKKTVKKKGGKEYVAMQESETSESDRSTPADSNTPVKHGVPSTSTAAEAAKSKGAIPKIKTSQSWTDASTAFKRKLRSKSTEQGEHFNVFKGRSAPPKTRSMSKSPFRPKDKEKSPVRSESKSPLKRMRGLFSHGRLAEEKDPLLDYEDGVQRVETIKPKSPKEVRSHGAPKISNKDLTVPEREPSDDESTSKSSMSETSSMAKATGALNIIESNSPDSDDMEEPVVERMVLRGSASAHAIMQKKKSEDQEED